MPIQEAQAILTLKRKKLGIGVSGGAYIHGGQV